MKLLDLTREYYTLSIIGMCKNAGKTTVLNRLIEEMTQEKLGFAITSIGRDGEGADIVTHTEKPGIYVPEGTLVATAFSMLEYCDVTREILDATGIPTPLGEVIIFRARSDGRVQIAGPSLVSQLATVRDKFRSLGAGRVMLDGAISRKSLCTHSVSDATLLCTGASYNKDIDTVIEDTRYSCELLTLKTASDEHLRGLSEKGGITVVADTDIQCEPKTLEKTVRETENIRYILFGGAVTDAVLKPLIMSNTDIKNILFVAIDGSKMVLKRDTFDKIRKKGADFAVLNGVNPVAVTINPFSAYGFHFDKNEFFEKMSSAVSLPVINVRDLK